MHAPRVMFALTATLGLIAASIVYAAPAPLDPRIEKAVTRYRQDGAANALFLFEGLARSLPAKTHPRDHAAAVHYIGECHWRLGDFPAARAALDEALTLERAAGDRVGEAKTVNVLGLLAWDQGDYDQAIERFKAAGAIAHDLGDHRLEGASLNNLSLVYDELGDYDTSLKQYQQVLALYRDANFPRGVGDTLGNIGGVHLLLGHFREAKDYYAQALAISERLKSTTSLGQDHGNLGLCLVGLGEADAALRHFDQAIAYAKKAGMRQDEAYWLRHKGNGLIQKGQYDAGLRAYRTALAVYEEVGAQAELAEALHDTGRLHLLLGDVDSAEKYFTRALDLTRRVKLARGTTLNLLALGDLQVRRRSYDVAEGFYRQAQARATQGHEQQLLTEGLLRLALVDREQGELGAAAGEASEALAAARRIAARPLEAEALLSQAEISRRRGQVEEALQGFSAAEVAAAGTGDPDLLWQIYFGRARAQEAHGDWTAAIDSLFAAVAVIESVRDQLQEPRFRAGYVDDKYEVYIELVRLQLELGRTADAFSTAERLRAHSYEEQLGGRSPLPLTPDDRRRETELRERIRHLRQALVDEDDRGQPAHPERALSRFSAELEAAEKDYQAFIDDHAGARHRERTPSLGVVVPEVQSRLADDEAVLEYIVGTDRLVAFVVTSTGLTAVTTAVGRTDLNARIALLRDLIRHPGDERWRKPASRLAELLIRPLERDGELRRVNRLYIVPHNALNYLPFALLPDAGDEPDRVLIDHYTLAYLPAAAALLVGARSETAPRSALAVAPARAHLRYAPEEARAVDAIYQPDSRLLLGTVATEGRFKQLAGDYRVVHLATHGYFDKANPLLSGLELERDANEDGLLQVHEVLDLRLRAELVTLSACETGLGSGYFADLPGSDEFVGMTRAFLGAGSASVMATLWDVDDQASVRLMRQFYQNLSSSGRARDAAAALGRVQRELHATSGFTHPYYWAPFILVGANPIAGNRRDLTAGRTP